VPTIKKFQQERLGLLFPAPCLMKSNEFFHYPRLLRRFALTEVEIIEFIGFPGGSLKSWKSMRRSRRPFAIRKTIHIIQTAIYGKADHICTLDEPFDETPAVTFCSERGLLLSLISTCCG